MKIDDSVYWNVDSNDGRGVNGGVYSDFDAEFRISNNEGVDSEVGYKVGSMNGISADKGVKYVKLGVSVGVGISVGWGVDIGIDDVNVSDYGIHLGLLMGMILVIMMASLMF